MSVGRSSQSWTLRSISFIPKMRNRQVEQFMVQICVLCAPVMNETCQIVWILVENFNLYKTEVVPHDSPKPWLILRAQHMVEGGTLSNCLPHYTSGTTSNQNILRLWYRFNIFCRCQLLFMENQHLVRYLWYLSKISDRKCSFSPTAKLARVLCSESYVSEAQVQMEDKKLSH